MPSWRTSCISASLNAFSPDFDAQYAAASGNAFFPARLLMLMIHPPPRFFMCGSTARQQWKTPVRFVSMTSCHCSTDISATGVKTPTPALLIRMSMPPKRSAAALKARSTSSYLRTSACCDMPSAPSSLIACDRWCALVPVMTTFASVVTRARAMARPMPRDPPVTTAVLPMSDDIYPGRITHRFMATVALIGAGDIGAACAHALAAHDRVGHILMIDAAVNAAAGKALDIQQAGAISGFHARLQATDDESRAVGCAAFVIADRFAAGSPEWQGEGGLALIKSVERLSPEAPIVFAGAGQAELLQASSREARVATRRLIGSATEAFAAAVAAIVAMEARCSVNEVSLA